MWNAWCAACWLRAWRQARPLVTSWLLCCVAGYLLDQTDSWSVIFGVVAGVYALGFVGFAALGSGEPQDYDAQ